MLRLLTTLCLAFACAAAHAVQYDIPGTRTTTWTPGVTVGVPGGIPTTRTNIINVTLTPYFADKTGAVDCTSALQAACAAAANGDIVYLPAGTYKTTNFTLPYYKSNFTIRGDGFGYGGGALTKIVAQGYVGILAGTDPVFGQYGAASSTITAGATKGSTSLTVTSGTGFAAGMMAQILVPNDPTVPVLHTSGGSNIRNFTVWVTAVSGNTITIANPLPNACGAGSTIRTTISPSQQFVGIESLLIDGTGGDMPFGIFYQGLSYGCWILDVKILGAVNYGIFHQYSVMPEIRRCWVDGGGGSGTNHSGLLINSVTGPLVEDNIILNSQPLIEVNFGTNTMVFAFNYTDGDDFGLDINHGPQNSFNLYEGNVTARVIADGYFGGTNDDTIFRNWITGRNAGHSVQAVALKRFSIEENLVGNIIQSPGVAWGDDGVQLGYPNIGNNSFNGSANSATDTTADMAAGVPKSWVGTLTTRTSDTAGTFTMVTGGGAALAAHKAASLSGQASIGAQIQLGTIVGELVTLSTIVDGTQTMTLPIAGTVVTFWPSQDGFQEIDTKVTSSILRKGNYYFYSASIPAGESLAGQTLANSLFRSAKPAYWGSLAWPAFNAAAPGVPAITQIPAGSRYLNADVLPNPSTVASTSATATTVTVVATATTGGTGAIQYNHAIDGTYAGLQASPSRTFTGLTPSTSYAFKVKAQDSAVPTPNTTTESAVSNVSTTGTVPTVSSVTVPSAGTTIVVALSASCTTGTGGSGGFTATVTTGAALTISSVAGSGSSTYTLTTNRTILATDVFKLNYAQPGNGIEATTGGADLASFTLRTVTNNSTQVAPTAPTVSAINIPAAGTTTVITWSQSATNGAGGSGGFTATASGGALTLTYSTGSPGTTTTLTNSRTVNAGETVVVNYVQPGNGVEGTVGGVDVASFSGRSVLNASTAGIPTTTPTPPAPDRIPKPKKKR